MPADSNRGDRLLATLERRWSELLASYDDLPDEELSETGVVGEWSVKNLIAHVSIWEMEAVKHLPVIAAGKRPPRYSVDVRWNRRLQRPDNGPDAGPLIG